ncbi:MAG: complex I NDUFA9 subunit family protein [Paracoccaceae bacterium]
MANLVTIIGGSGFVGRYVALRMARQGWRVRVAVRRPNEAIHVKPYGSVGQVEPVLCNIRDDASVKSVISGSDAVVNCVGILTESGRNKFDAVQHEGATRVARLAATEGVLTLVHISAIGADKEALSAYSRSKVLGELGVLKYFPNAMILRPSVIFGSEDQFFNKFAKMSRLTPVLPIVGGNSLMQPVYVDDVAKAAVSGVLGKAKPGVYELGGPEVMTLRSVLNKMLDVTERRRLILNLPFLAGGVVGALLDFTQAITGGLFSNTILTRDQVKSLRNDSIVSPDAKGFADLEINPQAMDSVLPEYLWPYRPSGQYAAIKASAKNLNI